MTNFAGITQKKHPEIGCFFSTTVGRGNATTIVVARSERTAERRAFGMGGDVFDNDKTLPRPEQPAARDS
jgi:hypothetical protein